MSRYGAGVVSKTSALFRFSKFCSVRFSVSPVMIAAGARFML